MSDIEQRFLSKVVKHQDGCWVWLASQTTAGYGRFIWSRGYLAHRFAYEYYVDLIPDDLTIDHICRNRSCVNPDHLRLATMRDQLDNSNIIANLNRDKTHCPSGHEYNINNTNIRSNGSRQCRVCDRIRQKNKRNVSKTAH